MKRWLLVLAIVLTLPIVAAGVLLHTTAPLQWAAGKLPDWTNGMVAAGSAGGTLAGVIVLEDIRVKTGTMEIAIARIEAESNPTSLLAGTIDLPRIRISDVRYVPLRSDDPERAADAFNVDELVNTLRLPVALDFPQVRIAGFSLCRDGARGPCESWLEEISFGLQWTDDAIDVTGLDGHSAHSSAKGEIRAGLADDHAVSARIDVKSGIRQPPLAAHLDVDGTLQELAFTTWITENPMPGPESSPARDATVSLQGSLRDVTGAPQLDARLEVNSLNLAMLNDWLGLSLPEETWSLHGKLDGSPADLAFSGQVDGSFEPLSKIAGDVSVRWQPGEMNIRASRLDILPLSKDASLEATLRPGNEFSWKGSVQLPQVQWPGTQALGIRSVNAEAHGNADRLAGKATATAFGASSEPFTLEAELDFESLAITATVDAPLMELSPALALSATTATLKGKPSDYHIEGNGNALLEIAGNSLPSARWRVSADGNQSSVHATLQQLAWLDGEFNGRVNVGWQDTVRLDGRLAGQRIDIAPLAKLVGVRASSRLSPAFDFRFLPGDDSPGNDLQFSISRFELGGSYNQHEVDGGGELGWRNGQVTARDFRLAIGASELKLDSGNDNAGNTLAVKLEIPDVATLVPAAAGKISLSVDIDASLLSPAANGSLVAESVRWQDWKASLVELDLDLPFTRDRSSPSAPLDIRPGASGKVSAVLENFHSPGGRIDAVRLDIHGTRGAHDFELQAEAARHEVRLKGSGKLDAANLWQGRLEAWQVNNSIGLPQWQLASAGKIRISPDNITFSTHCLESGSARACLGPLHHTEKTSQLNATLEHIPLASLEPLFPGGIRLVGNIDGDMQFKRDATGRQGKATLQLHEGRITERRYDAPDAQGDEPQAVDESEEIVLADWNSGQVGIRLKDRVLTANASADFSQGKAQANGRVEFPRDGKTEQATLAGRAEVRIADLSLLPAFFPRLREVHGKLQAGMEIGGTLGTPLLSGTLDFTNGSAELTPLGTTWNDIELHLTTRKNRLEGKGSLQSDGGRLDIEISGDARGKGLAASLFVKGENFLAMSTPEAVIRLSPSLKMQLEDRHVEATGLVKVPFARIRPRDYSSAVQVSDDQVIVNRSGTGDSQRFTYNARVTTELGEDVSFEGFGLDANVDGRLTVSARSGTPATGSGEVSIESGEYRIYGQELTIVRGKLIYTGQPLTEPGLDIRAVRNIRSDLTVGLILRGTATQPQLEVFSEPPMSQGETLSYLISGGSIAQATGAEQQQVDSASVALGLGAGKIFSQVGDRVGVDEVRFSEIGNREEASLILGKYLSPDLYVGYGIGLFDAVNSFRVNYQLSSKWTLEAISGIKSSADLIYTIER